MKIRIEGVEEFEATIADIIRNTTEKEIKQIVNSVINTYKDREYLTRKESANYLRCSLPTIDKATKSGIIKSYRIMGTILYLKNDLDCSLLERRFTEARKGGKNGK